MAGLEIAGLVENKTYVGIYFAILLILLVMIVYYVRQSKKERMTDYGVAGAGVQDRVNTSGATQRFAGGFSQPGQGDHTTPYNADLLAVAGALAPPAAPRERLVNTGGYPDFWEISAELGAYKDDTVDAYRSATAAAGGNAQAGADAAGIGPTERFQAQAAQDALNFAIASGNMNPISAGSMLYS